jgi:hypothetical protein
MPVGSNWAQDDHPSNAIKLFEGLGMHRQVTLDEAVGRGWYYRPAPLAQLEPDTRKCACHGDVMYSPLNLTDAEKKIRHPLSTQVLLGEDGF